MLHARLVQYEHNHQSTMSTEAAAQLLSVTLYYRRFFPYYAFCMLAGLDENGKGAVYGYDAVGSFKRDDYGCMGSGQNFIMPILDNLVCLLRPDGISPPHNLSRSDIRIAMTPIRS